MFALPRCTAVLAALCLTTTPSISAIVAFQRVTDNSAIDVSDDFAVHVTDFGGSALFEIINGNNYEGVITEIYIQDGAEQLRDVEFLAAFSTEDVAYTDGARPARPPGLRPFTPSYSFNPANPAPKFGVDGGETGAFLASYSGTYEDLELAILNGEIRFALHAQALPDGESDTFSSVLGTDVIPEPGTSLLALLGVGFLLRRRRP